jgi:uncharacterized protein with HEPN domain
MLREASSFRDFETNHTLQSALLYQFVIIGEAVHHLSPALLAKYPEVDWAGIDAMRNFLVHAYHRVDLNIIWKTATIEVPNLEKTVVTALRQQQ